MLLVLWFTIEPSSKQQKGPRIKNINGAMDAVPSDSLVPCKGLVVKIVLQSEKPTKWEETYSQGTTFYDIMMGVTIYFLKGLPTTAGNSLLHYDAMLRSSIFYWVTGLPKCHNWLVEEQLWLSWLKVRFIFLMHTCVVCYYCPQK